MRIISKSFDRYAENGGTVVIRVETTAHRKLAIHMTLKMWDTDGANICSTFADKYDAMMDAA